MLEGLVASLLNRFLGAYVKNFDPKQLNIGIWSGDVKLRKLELKREALDKFRLPIDVVEGHLGELTLQIPWSNLKNKPVKIFIENVYLLAIPKANQEYDEAEEERRKQMLKLERLEDAELLLQAQPSTMTAEEQKKNQSFTESLVTKARPDEPCQKKLRI
ncbi:N-terminal region of Chorein, a TM vesicle-mediated sorter-domain-containing protein [Lipomyces tetrasporus]